MAEHASPRSRGARTARVLGLLLALASLVVVGGAVVVVAVLPRAVSGEAMTVLTGSMEPTIPTGSVALVRPVDPQTVQVGDIVTYQVREDEAVFVTHRVADIRERNGQRRYILRGDANNGTDDPILGDRIRGEVWFHVPYLGAIRDALHGRGGVYLIASLLLAWFAISQITAGLRERREQRRPTVREDGATVTLDLPAVLARFAVAPLAGTASPADLAADLGGQVVAQGADSCCLLVVTTVDRLDRLLDQISGHEPQAVHVAVPGTPLSLPDGAPVGLRTADLDPAG